MENTLKKEQYIEIFNTSNMTNLCDYIKQKNIFIIEFPEQEKRKDKKSYFKI